jgi:RecB family exonuclease
VVGLVRARLADSVSSELAQQAATVTGMNAMQVSSTSDIILAAPLPSSESYSSISTYEWCPRRYAYRYVERLPGEVAPDQFAFGTAIHRAFEVFVRQRIESHVASGPEPDPEVLWAAFGEAIDISGCTPDAAARYHVRAQPVLARFLVHELESAGEPIGVEMGFGVDLDVPGDSAGVRFVGFIDRVDRRPDGTVEVVDYKTGVPKDQASVDRDVQLTAYAFALARGGLHDPADGGELPPAARLGLYFADEGRMVWTTRSPDQLSAFCRELLAVVRQVRLREFAARPSQQRCAWCEYRRLCPEAVA